jgi:hypothetical protein
LCILPHKRNMDTIASALDIEVMVFLYAMAAIVAVKLLTGGIATAGLLTRKDESGAVSSTRVQLLIITVAAAVYYLSKISTNTTSQLPDVPPDLLYGFGGSAGLYALRKAWLHRSKFKGMLGG